MSASATRVIVFDELLGLDESLRAQARTVGDVGSGIDIDAGGLPPEAQAVVDDLRGIGRTIGRGAEQLVKIAAEFGQTAADALGLDRKALELAWGSLRGNVLPGKDDSLPVWAGGRVLFAIGAAHTFGRRTIAMPWWARSAKSLGPRSVLTPVLITKGQRRMFGSGPRLTPLTDKLLARGGRIGGTGLTVLSTYLRRHGKEGQRGGEVVVATSAESASIVACGIRGAKFGARRGWQTAVAGGIVGGALCTGPGRKVGDFAGGVYNDHVPKPVKDVLGSAAKGVDKAVKAVDPYENLKGLAKAFRR